MRYNHLGDIMKWKQKSKVVIIIIIIIIINFAN